MGNRRERENPTDLSDMEMDAATGGTSWKEVAVSGVKSPRDPACGQATGKVSRGFTADSFSFGVERE